MNFSLSIAHEIKEIVGEPFTIVEPMTQKDYLDFKCGFLVVNDSIQSLVLNGELTTYSGDDLSEIIEKASKITSLEVVVIMRFNTLNTLPDNISLLENTKSLEISRNGLKSIPDTVYDLSDLRFLNLTSNEITSINPKIANLKNLREFRAGYNNITTIPDEIATLKQLEILSLYNNHIESVPKELSQLTKLKVLDLQNNKIKKIPKEIETMQTLERLKY